MLSLKIRILGILVGALVMFMVVYLVRRNKLSTIYSLTWFVLSLGIITFSLFKELIFDVAKLMGIHFPPLAFFILALLGLTFILIHLSIIVSSQFKLIKKLEKEVAILKLKQ